jgi:menaquinone-dependent protoporphyrinogen IX oxidase
MNAIVIYASASGFTRKYAEWIAEELRCDLLPRARVRVRDLLDRDVVIYGGRLHAGGISGVGLIKRNLGRLAGKKVCVFACGASPVRDETVAEIRDRNFSRDQQSQVRFFYLRGGFDFAKLRGLDRFLMSLRLRMILRTRESERTADETGMLAAFAAPADFTDRSAIRPLVEYARS